MQNEHNLINDDIKYRKEKKTVAHCQESISNWPIVSFFLIPPSYILSFTLWKLKRGKEILQEEKKMLEWINEMFYLTTHSTRFIYGYMASDIWLRTILIVRKETRCRHIGYSYRLTARVLLYAPSHRQDCTYHGLCYTSHGALAGTRNSSMGAPLEVFPVLKMCWVHH